MSPTERVSAELLALCYRARVAPDDAGESAARAVCAALDREIAELPIPNEHRDRWPCPLNAWLSARCAGVKVLVTMARVVLPRVVVGALPERGSSGGKGRAFASVPLPNAVRAAVALVDAHQWVSRRESA